jgi:hypothetical protein
VKHHQYLKYFLTDDLSQERIIEEFNKVFEHSLSDINVMKRYINFINYYDMWNEYFPNIVINKNINFDILNKSIVYYELFKSNDFKLLNKLKFDNKTINEMNFIREYSKINDNNIYKLIKLKIRYNISNEFLFEITKHFKIDVNLTKSFIKYFNAGFIVDGKELSENGFIGKEIETEKERLETERFIKYFKTNL